MIYITYSILYIFTWIQFGNENQLSVMSLRGQEISTVILTYSEKTFNEGWNFKSS